MDVKDAIAIAVKVSPTGWERYREANCILAKEIERLQVEKEAYREYCGHQLIASIYTKEYEMEPALKRVDRRVKERMKAAEKAATVGGACTEEALLPVLDQIALDLCRGLGLTNLKTGYLLVKTQPSGAVVDVQGVTKGTSPLTLELDSGNYPLRAHTEGYEDKQDSAVVSPGRTAGITLVLRRIVPMDPMEKWGHAAFWAGVGVTAFGGVSTFLFKSAQDDYRDGKWDVEGDIEQWHTLMWTGFSVGGALMVTGALLWILSPSEQEWRQEWIEKHPTVGVSSDGDDFFVTVGGEW